MKITILTFILFISLALSARTANTDLSNRPSGTYAVLLADTTAPVLILNGDDTVLVDVYHSYTEAGVTVDDECSNVLWEVDLSPDTAILGFYILTYSAVDCNGNHAIPIKRVVKVVDREDPVCTLLGDSPLYIERGQPYTDPGINATDNYDVNLTITPFANFANTNDTGHFTICYTVKDASGNTCSICRDVIISEKTSVIRVSNAQVRTYPNPTSSVINVEFKNVSESDINFEIKDVTGKTVYSGNMKDDSGSYMLDLSFLQPGVYNLIISTGTDYHLVKVGVIR